MNSGELIISLPQVMVTPELATGEEVYFKKETIKGTNIRQVNIGLGRNTSESGGLKLFNDNIINFEIIE